jgi:hypothetical protein
MRPFRFGRNIEAVLFCKKNQKTFPYAAVCFSGDKPLLKRSPA